MFAPRLPYGRRRQLLAATAFAAEPLPLKERWVYIPTNFAVVENVDKLESLLLERAHAAGYTHVMVTD